MADNEKLAAAAEFTRHVRPLALSMVELFGPDAALMGLAQVAGDVIAATASSAPHLEEGLEIFGDLTADQARGRFLSDAEPQHQIAPL